MCLGTPWGRPSGGSPGVSPDSFSPSLLWIPSAGQDQAVRRSRDTENLQCSEVWGLSRTQSLPVIQVNSKHLGPNLITFINLPHLVLAVMIVFSAGGSCFLWVSFTHVWHLYLLGMFGGKNGYWQSESKQLFSETSHHLREQLTWLIVSWAKRGEFPRPLLWIQFVFHNASVW